MARSCLYAKHKSAFEEIFYDNSLYRLGDILKDFKYKEDTENSYAFSSDENKFFVNLYKLIAYTRDISHHGRGNRNNTYAQLVIWNDYFPNLAKAAIENLVKKYGCWRDIRQFCHYYKEVKGNLPDIVDFCTELMAKQIAIDIKTNGPISNASKWCPREKNKQHGWLFPHIACKYFGKSILTTTICKDFRNILSALNRYNKVPQVNFCENTWSKIDTISHKTYSNHKKAIHNVTAQGNTRYPDSPDRNRCAEQFFFYGNQYNSPCKPLPYKYLSGLFRPELINKVVNLYDLNMRNHSQFGTVDQVWKSCWEKDLPNLNDIIPVIETSTDMKNSTTESKTAFINAITIASTILNQQNNVRITGDYSVGTDNLPDTLLCNYSKYEESAQFKKMEPNGTITSVLTHLLGGLKPNFNTTSDSLTVPIDKFDFSKFYDMFLMKLVYEKHHPDIANRKTLLFLCSDIDKKRLERKLKKKYDRCVMNYHRTGIQLTGFPYKPPKIIVWNMDVSELPTCSRFSIGKKNTDEVTIINSKSDSRYNCFTNFTELFYEDATVPRFNNIEINLSKSRYDEFNPFLV
jgi:hypothetical protein